MASKAEYSAYLAHVVARKNIHKQKLKQTNASAPLIQYIDFGPRVSRVFNDILHSF